MPENYINLNQILDNTIEGIVIIEDGFIKDVNKSLLNIMNYEDKKDLIGNLVTGMLIPTSTNKYIEYNSETFQEISILTKDAILVPAIIRIKDIQTNNKSYKMVSILDMSEYKEKEKILIEQSRLAAMGEMISIIAHQWRQPLNAVASIITRLKLKIKMNKLDNALVDEKADEISNYLQYMSSTIDDFKNFLEPNINVERISLNEIVDDSLKIVSQSLKANNINVNIGTNKLADITIQKNEFIQVIINIINNAKDVLVEKSIENPSLLIRFYENQNIQKLEIEDNAGGIPEDILNKIFEPYYSTKDKKNGTGLGLYISKIIVEKYSNGKIFVDNTKTGALFTIQIDRT